jgi:DNA polymerase III subunit epsilon
VTAWKPCHNVRAMRRNLPVAPPRAGRRRPWRETPFAALDFETTGLDFARDRIVSYGVVPVEHGLVDHARSVYELVDPGPVPISPASVAIHGLTPEKLRGAPSAQDARVALSLALGGRFLLTWHGYVEAAFLAMLYGTSRRRWLARSVDVRWLVLDVLGPEADRLTLSEAADRFGVRVDAPHHALDDALVTARLFVAAVSRSGTPSTRELLRLGRARGVSAGRLVVPR